MKNRYFIEIAFNGTKYHGWQKQPGHISVQQVFNERISLMLGENINCNGCGRTDSGVHAAKFFFHFDTTHELNSDFAFKLNSFLPRDICVKKMFGMKKKIHARWDAIRRTYEYYLYRGKDPFRIDLVTNTWEKYNLQLMNEACRILMEYNDFECFSKSKNGQNHYLCDIFEANWREGNRLLVFRITANRFVRSMVRLVVGTMLDVGRERTSLDEFRRIIESRDRTKSGMAVPACGLYLVDVIYPEGVFIEMENENLS